MKEMYAQLGISSAVYDFGHKIEESLKERFEKFDKTAEYNQMKVLLAMQKNIKVTYEVLLPEKSNIPSSELSSIFFNLLDNGIESCNTSGSEAPFISVTSKMSAGFLTVHMQNSKS